MHRLIKRALAMFAVLASHAARADDCPDLAAGELGAGLIEHTCFHTTNGPYASVAATPGTVPGAATANLDPVHTLFTIAIDPSRDNVVTYAPARSGRWAVFGDALVPHAMIAPDGRELAIELAHTIDACPAIPSVQVYTLTAGTRYTLVLGRSQGTGATTPVVIEKLSDFEIPHGRDRDGDGFGGAADVVMTACVPPSGFVRNVADCDDGDRTIHPEAAESCNGIDDNCNGIADDGVCAVGGGGCAGAPGSPASPLVVVVVLAAGAVLARSRLRR